MLWSPSSTTLLAASPDQLHAQSVGSAAAGAGGPPALRASVRNPASSGAGSRPPLAHIAFGARDEEVLVFAALGLKLLVYDLAASSAVEVVPSPKFFHQPGPAGAAAAVISRAYSLRPATGHLALLTRTAGRDTVSVHHPETRVLQRSWSPDTSDAHGLAWSPDGSWLLVWESPAHGRRLLLYTPDGQLFRALTRFGNSHDDGGGDDDDDAAPAAALEPGIKLCRFSPDGSKCLILDHSRSIAVLDTATWRTQLVLTHPVTIEPQDTLQVWQEQLGASSSSPSPTFVRATQPVSPLTTSTNTTAAAGNMSTSGESTRQTTDHHHPSGPSSGCSSATLDASSTLLVSRLDDSPGALWIWDLAAAELRAVLLFHARAVDWTWHPRSRELLLIRCLDDAGAVTIFTWDPLSAGPVYVPLAERLFTGTAASGSSARRSRTGGNGSSGGSGGGVEWRNQALWLDADGPPTMLLSDGKMYCLAAMGDAPPSGWQGARGSCESMLLEGDSLQVDLPGDDTSMLEDTFSFKHG